MNRTNGGVFSYFALGNQYLMSSSVGNGHSFFNAHSKAMGRFHSCARRYTSPSHGHPFSRAKRNTSTSRPPSPAAFAVVYSSHGHGPQVSPVSVIVSSRKLSLRSHLRRSRWPPNAAFAVTSSSNGYSRFRKTSRTFLLPWSAARAAYFGDSSHSHPLFIAQSMISTCPCSAAARTTPPHQSHESSSRKYFNASKCPPAAAFCAHGLLNVNIFGMELPHSSRHSSVQPLFPTVATNLITSTDPAAATSALMSSRISLVRDLPSKAPEKSVNSRRKIVTASSDSRCAFLQDA
mmetsp:Transcript_2846/g.9254  ORF Transcript_2846/g.9254 Transcript_2846/m.9254 type:complete len:291 (+) Transcript_2846:617-1489(+)